MGHEVLVNTNDTDVSALSSLEIMQNLTDEQRSRYSAFQETFESSGWPLVVEWAQVKALEAEKRGMAAEDQAEWRRQQGVRQTWEDVVRLAEMFMNEFENVALQNKIDAETAAEADEFGIEAVTDNP